MAAVELDLRARPEGRHDSTNASARHQATVRALRYLVVDVVDERKQVLGEAGLAKRGGRGRAGGATTTTTTTLVDEEGDVHRRRCSESAVAVDAHDAHDAHAAVVVGDRCRRCRRGCSLGGAASSSGSFNPFNPFGIPHLSPSLVVALTLSVLVVAPGSIVYIFAQGRDAAAARGRASEGVVILNGRRRNAVFAAATAADADGGVASRG